MRAGATVTKETVARAIERARMRLDGFARETCARPEAAYVLDLTGVG